MVDRFMTRRYHPRDYNCAHLVVEFFEQLGKAEVARALQGYLCAPNDRRSRKGELARFKVLDKPMNPCVVLMQNKGEAHVGVYWKRRVLHIQKDQGVQYVPLEVASLMFKRTRFIAC